MIITGVETSTFCSLPILIKVTTLGDNPWCILTKVHPPPPNNPTSPILMCVSPTPPPALASCADDRTAWNVSEDSGVSIFPFTSYLCGGWGSCWSRVLAPLFSPCPAAALPCSHGHVIMGSGLGTGLLFKAGYWLPSSFTWSLISSGCRDISHKCRVFSGPVLFMLGVYYFYAPWFPLIEIFEKRGGETT